MAEYHYSLQINEGQLLQNINQPLQNKKFSVVFRCNNLQQRTQLSKVQGGILKWLTFFPFQLDQQKYPQIQLELLMDEQQIGSKKLTYKRIKRQFLNRKNCQVILQKHSKSTAKLYINLQEHSKEDIKGGILPPNVNLNPHHHKFVQSSTSFSFQSQTSKQLQQVVEYVPPEQSKKDYGFQINRAQKLNAFSCMDADDLQTQFFPSKFRSKCSK